MSATAVIETPPQAAQRPYGVHVGDVVYFWAEGAPPLCQEYVKPDCKAALVISFGQKKAPWMPTETAVNVWTAHLAYVDHDGSLRVLTGVPQVEGSASANGRGRSYGTVASWHRAVIHASETTQPYATGQGY